MKKFIFIQFLFAFICLSSTSFGQFVKVCEVFGTVYEEKKNEFAATYRVYIEDNEYSADVIVFKETNELKADKPGLWFFTPHKAFAEFSIYIVEDRNIADFTIYFTEVDVEAKCNK